MLKKKQLKLLLLCTLALCLFAPGALVKAALPSLINYQGRLSDSLNAPLTGQYDFRFRLYDDAAKTTLLWGPEEYLNESVSNGYFSVPLGSVESFSAAGLDFTDQYWLTIQIKENSSGTWDDETDPPVAFSANAYSLNAEKVESASGFVAVGGTIQGGAALVGAELALSVNTGAGFSGKLLSLLNNGAEHFSVGSDGELHWMDGGYVDAYFNLENIVAPYSGNPNFAGLYLDSATNRSTLFGEFVYLPGSVGVGTMLPSSILDIKGAVSFGGMVTSPVSNMGDARIYYDGGLNQLLLSKNAGPYEAILTEGDQLWQQNSLVLSPNDPLAEKIEINKSVNNLIGMKITNVNDVNNYAGSVLELKGSGADYTNNLYFGKYGDGFWVPSWAGNGVLATDQDLILGSMGSSDVTNPNVDPRIIFQVGGGYTTPITTAVLSSDNFNFLPYGTAAGNTSSIRFSELAANGSNYVALKAADNIAADIVWTLPSTDGAAGNVLTTNGSGLLSWGATASPTVSNGLYNDAGTLKLGGDLVENTYLNHQGYSLIVREFAGEPETQFNGDNFKIVNSGLNREVRFGIGGLDFSGLSFDGNNQHDIFYRDDYLYVTSNSLAFSGLQYATDYSANFVDRSLVDKAYVDSHINEVTMQGAADNSIAADGYVYYNTGAVEHEDDGGAGKIEVHTGGYEFELRNGDYGSRLNFRTESAPGLDDGWMKIDDNRPTTRGLEYNADYSAGYTARSLVDKEYVDNGLETVTLQLATDNSVAADGYASANFGASYLEDLGSSAIFGANPGGKTITFGDGDGNGLFIYSYRDASNPAQIKLVDNRGAGEAHGLEYNADYSTDYTARSLVDKAYVDALIPAGGVVTQIDLTVATTDGAFSSGGYVGYQAANDMCEAEFSGSHFCRTDEIIEYIAYNSTAAFAGTAWIAEGPPGYTSNSNDCNGWTVNAATSLGAFWEFVPAGGGMGWLTNCGVAKPVACCQ